VRRIDAVVSDAMATMAPFKDDAAGRIVIGTGATACIHLLPPLLQNLRRNVPALQILVRIDNTADILRLLEENLIDVALVTGPVYGRAFSATPVFEDEQVAIRQRQRRMRAAAEGRVPVSVHDQLGPGRIGDVEDGEATVTPGGKGKVARHEGMVRFVGITGHYDPAVLAEAIRRYPFDTVLVALNVADRARLSFIEELLPLANERGLGIIGMKVLAKGRLLRPDGVATAQEALGYVLSLPISTAIVGFRSLAEVDEAVEMARRFTPFSPEEMARLEARARPSAEELSWFKRET